MAQFGVRCCWQKSSQIIQGPRTSNKFITATVLRGDLPSRWRTETIKRHPTKSVRQKSLASLTLLLVRYIADISTKLFLIPYLISHMLVLILVFPDLLQMSVIPMENVHWLNQSEGSNGCQTRNALRNPEHHLRCSGCDELNDYKLHIVSLNLQPISRRIKGNTAPIVLLVGIFLSCFYSIRVGVCSRQCYHLSI